MIRLLTCGVFTFLALTFSAEGETVCVKYGPCPLDLSKLACTDTVTSSFVRRVCYDEKKRFVAIKLNETWYPYCDVDDKSVRELLSAPSIGKHYNDRFRSRRDGAHGPFDCRDRPLPTYP
jgi:KTSC domain